MKTKRIISLLASAAMTVSLAAPSLTMTVSAEETTDAEAIVAELGHLPGGLMDPEITLIDDVDYDASKVITYSNGMIMTEAGDCESVVDSAIYGSKYDKYKNNYVYNLLTDTEKKAWDAAYDTCVYILNSDEYVSSFYVDLSGCRSFLTDDAYIGFHELFKYSNPQFYFISNGWSYSYSGKIYFSLYDDFCDGSSRTAATNAFFAQADAWEAAVAGYSTDYQKAVALHDIICNKVTYDWDFYYSQSSYMEQQHKTQSAYSVLVLNTTVCSGYAQSYELMCNAVGIDNVAVTGSGHAWSKVRLDDDNWYNIDLTWDDCDPGVDYWCFAKSDDTVGGGDGHEIYTYWAPVRPLCNRDSSADYDAGSLPANYGTCATPVLNGTTLSCSTPGATIYYTLDGTTPSCSFTKSYVYNGYVSGDTSKIKAIACADGYYDSEIMGAVNTNAIKEFVTRLYNVCLDRNPDEGGLNDWANRLANGTESGVSAAYGFIFSPEFKKKNYCNDCYVDHLYNAFMGRNADAGGKSYWVGNLESGMTREEVFNGFALSSEFAGICGEYGITQGSGITIPAYGTVPTGSCSIDGTVDGVTAFVTRLYNVCLDRNPDKGGLEDWTNKLWNHEKSGTDIAYGFIFSPEFQNRGFNNDEYVEYMYKAFFGRNSDAGGKADWLNRMEQGYSRKDVFDGFTGSQEFEKLCAKYGITK